MSTAALAQETPLRMATSERKIALGLLLSAFALSVTDRMILPLLFEPIKAEFNLSDAPLGLLGGLTFALFYASLGVPLTKYANMHNRRRLIAACPVLYPRHDGEARPGIRTFDAGCRALFHSVGDPFLVCRTSNVFTQ